MLVLQLPLFFIANSLQASICRVKSQSFFIAVVIHPALFFENPQKVKAYMNQKFGSGSNDFILLKMQMLRIIQ